MSEKPWKERTVEAMGWKCAMVYGLLHIWTDPDCDIYKTEADVYLTNHWDPAENYNHAMMMRDALPGYDRARLPEAIWRAKFREAPPKLATARWMNVIAYATARQIADAVLSVRGL